MLNFFILNTISNSISSSLTPAGSRQGVVKVPYHNMIGFPQESLLDRMTDEPTRRKRSRQRQQLHHQHRTINHTHSTNTNHHRKAMTALKVHHLQLHQIPPTSHARTVLINNLQDLGTWSTKHMKRHTRPYKCTVPACTAKGFELQSGLDRHVKEKHPETLQYVQRYFCPFRDNGGCRSKLAIKGTTRSDNVDRHVEWVHRGQRP
ncbi:hypothetical protein QBC46DRAFT_17221 [Diplogelasinospora grovesii]|uniref:C2H2-type domain-containing protein n=1 Tax=Diplogelasinospora grovesii TaxID=303347 RepID=A0AAN6S1L3_9PEZI|nr:hypothetical protein QBC46DRAFT_17221 [Diplogelasinospora grovesii]